MTRHTSWSSRPGPYDGDWCFRGGGLDTAAWGSIRSAPELLTETGDWRAGDLLAFGLPAQGWWVVREVTADTRPNAWSGLAGHLSPSRTRLGPWRRYIGPALATPIDTAAHYVVGTATPHPAEYIIEYDGAVMHGAGAGLWADRALIRPAGPWPLKSRAEPQTLSLLNNLSLSH